MTSFHCLVSRVIGQVPATGHKRRLWSSRRLSPLGALCASVAKTSALTLPAKKSIAAQRSAPVTRSSLRWRLALEHHLDASLRPLWPLVAFRAGRLAPHHRSLHSVGWPPRADSLV